LRAIAFSGHLSRFIGVADDLGAWDELNGCNSRFAKRELGITGLRLPQAAFRDFLLGRSYHDLTGVVTGTRADCAKRMFAAVSVSLVRLNKMIFLFAGKSRN
jgi:hypothetical protein